MHYVSEGPHKYRSASVWIAEASSQDSLATLFHSGFFCSIINVEDNNYIPLSSKDHVCDVGVCMCVVRCLCLLWVVWCFFVFTGIGAGTLQGRLGCL